MKNKKYIFVFLGVIMSTSPNIVFAWFGNEYSVEAGKKAMEEDEKWSNWLKKYIEDVLYVGMPVDKFIKLFTKDEGWTDPERPYIISHNKNRYIFIGINKTKFRVSFKNGLLEKLEQYGWEKFILHYTDASIYLKGYNNPYAHTFYSGMPEEEFLKIYSGAILVHKKNWYIIKEKNGLKWKVIFENGYLSGSGGESTF